MIQKDWKKRILALKKNKYINIAGIGMLTLGFVLGIIAGIATDEFAESMLITNLFFGSFVFAFYISEIFFQKDSLIDIILTNETQSERKVENENHTKTYHTIWNENRSRIPRVMSFYDIACYEETNEFLSTITYILEHCSLSEEEKHYFVQDFPDELFSIIRDYRELRGAHQERMKIKIRNSMVRKKKEWEQVYIDPLQNKLEEKCAKRVEKVFQEKKEKVYVTE